MIRVLLLTLTGFLFLSVSAQQDANAQNFFLSPNSSQSEDKSEKPNTALPKFVVPQRNVTPKAKTSARKAATRKANTQKARVMNTQDFEVFNQLQGLDLQMFARGMQVPSTQAELLELSAALNMSMVTEVLSMKRLLEDQGLSEAVRLTRSLF